MMRFIFQALVMVVSMCLTQNVTFSSQRGALAYSNITGWVRLIRSHSSTRFCFELSEI